MDTFGIIRSVVIGIAWIIADAAVTFPFWFSMVVQISWDGGQAMKEFKVGMYFMDTGSIDMTSLIQVEKASNAKTLPPMFRIAQIFYGLGSSGIFLCFIGSLIYTCRKYKTATGEMCLAGFLLPTTLCLLLGVIFVVLSVFFEGDHVWESLPVPKNYMQVEAVPVITISYGLYVAAVGTFTSLLACFFAWFNAYIMCRHVEDVRYQMLHAPLTEEERGAYTGPGQTYSFQLNKARGFRYDGYSKPGIEADF